MDLKRSSQTSISGISSMTRQSQRKYSNANLSMSSSGVPSSSLSMRSIIIEPPSMLHSGNAKKPIMPCIVLFAHKALASPAIREDDDPTRSFLIIDSELMRVRSQTSNHKNIETTDELESHRRYDC
jgi:hypothetical protein